MIKSPQDYLLCMMISVKVDIVASHLDDHFPLICCGSAGYSASAEEVGHNFRGMHV